MAPVPLCSRCITLKFELDSARKYSALSPNDVVGAPKDKGLSGDDIGARAQPNRQSTCLDQRRFRTALPRLIGQLILNPIKTPQTIGKLLDNRLLDY